MADKFQEAAKDIWIGLPPPSPPARRFNKYAGLTHRGVADTLGMKSGVGASLQARRAKELKECDRKAAKLIAAIEDELDGQMPEQVCE